jgi:hypothetical protein
MKSRYKEMHTDLGIYCKITRGTIKNYKESIRFGFLKEMIYLYWKIQGVLT